MTAEQAEGVAEAFSSATTEQLAAKADLAALSADLRAEMANTRAEIASQGADLRAEITAGRADNQLLKRMVGFGLTLIVAVRFLQLRH
jgi:hypothetical protein